MTTQGNLSGETALVTGGSRGSRQRSPRGA
jgi:hypothetical protein